MPDHSEGNCARVLFYHRILLCFSGEALLQVHDTWWSSPYVVYIVSILIWDAKCFEGFLAGCLYIDQMCLRWVYILTLLAPKHKILPSLFGYAYYIIESTSILEYLSSQI